MSVKPSVGHSPSMLAKLLPEEQVKLLCCLDAYGYEGAYVHGLMADIWGAPQPRALWRPSAWVDAARVCWSLWHLLRLGLIHGRGDGIGTPWYVLSIRGRLVLYFVRQNGEKNLQTSAS